MLAEMEAPEIVLYDAVVCGAAAAAESSKDWILGSGSGGM